MEAVWAMVLEPRGGQAGLTALQSKANTKYSHATHRQKDSFIDKAEGNPWPLQTGDPIWETESSLDRP